MAGPQYRQPETMLSGMVPVRASPLEQQIQQANQLIQSLSTFLQVQQLTRHERREIARALERLSEAVQDGSQRRLERAIGSAQELQADLAARYGQRQFPAQPVPMTSSPLRREWDDSPPLRRDWNEGVEPSSRQRQPAPAVPRAPALQREWETPNELARGDVERSLQQLRYDLHHTEAPLRVRSEVRRFIRAVEHEIRGQVATERLQQLTAQARSYDTSLGLQRHWE